MKFNKFFDKAFVTRGVFHQLTGDSILFEDSSEFWNNKRKKMSVAFYKDKLIKMVDIVKDCMDIKIKEFKEEYARKNKQMNLITEISTIQVKILLSCAFGEDVSDRVLDYYGNGEKTRKTVAFVLRDTFH